MKFIPNKFVANYVIYANLLRKTNDNRMMKNRLIFSFLFIIVLFLVNIHAQENKTILVFGDSIAAGFGVEPEQAFPALLQEKIDSLGLSFDVINAGLSGETSAGGLRRISWVLQRKVDIMILELGGNDGLRGIDLDNTKENLQQIITIAQSKNPDIEIIIAGMQVPPNLGIAYTKKFVDLYPQLAKENKLPLIPLILDKVGGYDKYMQPDQIHPNALGHKIVAHTVWETLETLIN